MSEHPGFRRGLRELMPPKGGPSRVYPYDKATRGPEAGYSFPALGRTRRCADCFSYWRSPRPIHPRLGGAQGD
ncbi:hypothetical protein SBA2_410043 [Acidobacteriia bacterium SbA2]|nr:hypothetical protein SBA2_410043 [Acidobacteriia bacterium SbA2]